ncbi:hypothetical protein EBR77_01755 [bacterium]|nr:hypothetical protein [bacterium]
MIYTIITSTSTFLFGYIFGLSLWFIKKAQFINQSRYSNIFQAVRTALLALGFFLLLKYSLLSFSFILFLFFIGYIASIATVYFLY